MIAKSAPCPCFSGKKYGECCAPLHEGVREPEHGEELVRSRYSAFSLGRVDYLIKTLHPDHPDKRDRADRLEIALRTASSSFKYTGLVIIETQPPDHAGIERVLYLARLFRKGTDVSFLELADFAHDGKGLRYLAGRTRDAVGMKSAPPGLAIANF